VPPPTIEMVGVTRQYAGPTPLRVRNLAIASGDRWVLTGLDRGAAEMFVLLVTGAAVPDAGTVRIDGRDTREITTDTAWLSSLDRFGIVTDRAVLIDRLSIRENLALPLTLSIDPLADEVRAQVDVLAGEAGLAVSRLPEPASTLTADERLRAHLARALALNPAVLLLEQPTAGLDSDDRRAAFGETMRALADRRGLGWIALTDDLAFARASRGDVRRLVTATGDIRREPLWRRLAAGLAGRSGQRESF
jgi:phospholipid/cholesterol/gamma-HCH transport system ATP-binding protein